MTSDWKNNAEPCTPSPNPTLNVSNILQHFPSFWLPFPSDIVNFDYSLNSTSVVYCFTIYKGLPHTMQWFHVILPTSLWCRESRWYNIQVTGEETEARGNHTVSVCYQLDVGPGLNSAWCLPAPTIWETHEQTRGPWPLHIYLLHLKCPPHPLCLSESFSSLVPTLALTPQEVSPCPHSWQGLQLLSLTCGSSHPDCLPADVICLASSPNYAEYLIILITIIMIND